MPSGKKARQKRREATPPPVRSRSGSGALSRFSKSPPPPGKASFEGPPLETGTDLAPAGSPAPGTSVDDISYEGSEQLLFHTHARLTIFVGGHERPVAPRPLIAPVHISNWAGL